MLLSEFLRGPWWQYARYRLKPRTLKNMVRALDLNVVPLLKNPDIATIKKRDVLALHVAMADRPVHANRAVSYLASVLSVAIDQGLIPEPNPAHGIRDYPEHHRERYLTQEEQERLWKAIPSTPEGHLMRVMLLTGARPGELQYARWEWLNGNLLRLPD